LAQHEHNGDLVVIKEIAAEWSIVLDEYRLARKVNSPHVMRPIAWKYNWGMNCGYLVLPYIFGKKLSDVRPSARHALDVRDGIDACHRAGVAHRSLHADNILVGHGDWCTIIDFGAAKSMECLDEDTRNSLVSKDIRKVRATFEKLI
jgi:serine/threonine protein kinase